LLVQALEEELPRGTIRYSSRIVSIQEDGNLKVLQLADGSELRAKVTSKTWCLLYTVHYVRCSALSESCYSVQELYVPLYVCRC
jgi:hypothetical protein